MKIFCCHTPSHNKLYHEDFVPTIPAGFTVQSEIIEMFGEGHYDSPQFVPCVVKKVDLILQSLHQNAGSVIIWSDVDIQFYRLTPETAMAELGDHDIAFQAAGVPPNEINSGFFICRCNQRVIQFFEKIRHSLCHEEAGEIEERVINKLLPTLSESELSWCMLPRSFYARSNKWPPPRNLVLHHANSTPGANGLEKKHRQLREVALLQRYRLPVLLYTCIKYAPRRVRRLWNERRQRRPVSEPQPEPAAFA
jgi:nucleotide-diphospho-sugar transferase